MIVQSDIFTEPQVRKLRDITYAIVKVNGNRRGVRQIDVVTHDLDHAKFHGSSVKDSDGVKNVGMWYPIHYHKDGVYTPGSVIWIKKMPNVVDMVITLAHEFAHGCAQGSHGYTWRRMNALILPFAKAIFEFDDIDVDSQIYRTITRYATNYINTSWDSYEAKTKKHIEHVKHMAASEKCWTKFQHMLSE